MRFFVAMDEIHTMLIFFTCRHLADNSISRLELGAFEGLTKNLQTLYGLHVDICLWEETKTKLNAAVYRIDEFFIYSQCFDIKMCTIYIHMISIYSKSKERLR